jgi:NADPH-dependent 7-cyano-7-deazaguanine reductase QueF
MAELQTFPSPRPRRAYTITHGCSEFTSVCPRTGQLDFGTIRISHVPDRLCVELKSALRPVTITVAGEFAVRGGISSVVRASHAEPRARARGRA